MNRPRGTQRVSSRALSCGALVFALCFSAGASSPRAQASDPSPQAQAQSASSRATVERWRESLLIDRPREVLAEAESHPSGAEWDGEALSLAARAAFIARGRPAAEKWLARTPVRAETTAWLELERARLALESDELAPALAALLRDAGDSAPRLAGYPDAWLYAGRAWTRLGEPARGAAFLARFVELAPLDPQAPSALHALAQEAIGRGDGAAAKRWLDRADENAKWQAFRRVRVLQIRESPDEPLPRLGLAQLWLQARQPAQAQRVLEELLARHADYATGWFHLGEAQRLLDDLVAASASYDKALELEPEHILARHNRATIHRLAGRLDQARADYERVVDGPRSSEKSALNSHLALARVLAAQGDAAGAQRRYARYLELGGKEPLTP